jgi:hypothetical protein
VSRKCFARAPGSGIWVWSGDLPDEAREKLCNLHSRNLEFPANDEVRF